jgi:hypothetical protein
MINDHLRARLEGILSVLKAQGNASGSLANASKDYEREIFVQALLKDLFPPQFRLGTGTIIDSKGTPSGQIDIAIELPNVPSFPIPPGVARIYLAEGVAAVIEVKSDLKINGMRLNPRQKKLSNFHVINTGIVSLAQKNTGRSLFLQ